MALNKFKESQEAKEFWGDLDTKRFDMGNLAWALREVNCSKESKEFWGNLDTKRFNWGVSRYT